MGQTGAQDAARLLDMHATLVPIPARKKDFFVNTEPFHPQQSRIIREIAASITLVGMLGIELRLILRSLIAPVQ